MKGNIIFITYNIYGIGGTVRHVVTNANYFTNKDYNVTIISINRTSDKPRLNIDKKIKIIPLKESRKNIKKNIVQNLLSKIHSILIHKDEDLYKNFSLYTDLKIILTLIKQKKSIIICTIPSFVAIVTKLFWKNFYIIAQEHKGFKYYTKSLKKLIIKKFKLVNCIHCVNYEDKEIYLSKFPNHNVRYICNTVDIDQSSIESKEKVIIAAGRLSKEKNFSFLLYSFALSDATLLNWKLHIYGAGEEENNLKSIALQLGISGYVYFIPPVDDIVNRYTKASIYASSSLRESFGLSTLEAMASSLPVIATDTVGSKILVKNNKTGFIISKKDKFEFSRKLNKLIYNNELRYTMGIAGKEYAKNFSIEKIGLQWVNLLNEASLTLSYKRNINFLFKYFFNR